LEALPLTKQIGYYSDAYKLEFVLPKFAMYKACLARVLVKDFVIARRWTEERALHLAQALLRDNVLEVFPHRGPWND
jgi:glucuronate isomerase